MLWITNWPEASVAIAVITSAMASGFGVWREIYRTKHAPEDERGKPIKDRVEELEKKIVRLEVVSEQQQQTMSRVEALIGIEAKRREDDMRALHKRVDDMHSDIISAVQGVRE